MVDDAIRGELVRLVSDATAGPLKRAPEDVTAVVDQVLSSKAGAALVADLLGDAHAHLLGDDELPVILTSQQMVQIVRDERAATVSPVLVDVPRITTLAVSRDVVGWLVPLAGIGIVVFLVLCFLARPDWSALVRTLGLGLLVLGALVALFGYVVPKFLPAALSDSVWARIPGQLADDGVIFVVVFALILAAAGLALFASSARMGRSRRWSTPVSTYRYREERRWS